MRANIYQTQKKIKNGAAKSGLRPSSKTCVRAGGLHGAETVSAYPDTDLNQYSDTGATLLGSMFKEEG